MVREASCNDQSNCKSDNLHTLDENLRLLQNIVGTHGIMGEHRWARGLRLCTACFVQTGLIPAADTLNDIANTMWAYAPATNTSGLSSRNS